jgi:hypothetical protein
MTQANNVAIESSQINSSGVLQPAGGGTGQSTLTANNVILGNGTSGVQFVAPGTNGNLLTSNGTTWVSSAAPSGMVYPGAGIANSTGSAWGTSYSTTGSGTVVALATSPTFVTPALGTPASGTLTNCTFPTLNQNTTGSAGSVANALTAGTNITFSSGTTYNGSAAITINSTSPIPSGTVTNFIQASAPTGWTQVTTWNNYAMRVVSGTGAGTGGSVAFTTAFASQTPAGSVSTSISAVSGSVGISGGSVGSYTLATADIPSHTHDMRQYGTNTGCGGAGTAGSGACSTQSNFVTNATGGGGSHTHSFSAPTGSFTFSSGTASSSFTGTAINLAVQYVDNIIASKN